jgi:hypothetical protein
LYELMPQSLIYKLSFQYNYSIIYPFKGGYPNAVYKRNTCKVNATV